MLPKAVVAYQMFKRMYFLLFPELYRSRFRRLNYKDTQKPRFVSLSLFEITDKRVIQENLFMYPNIFCNLITGNDKQISIDVLARLIYI